MHLYFAYGSNLHAAQMAKRCADSKRIGRAVLVGHRLDFTRRSGDWKGGVADIVPNPGHEVWGLLYQISDADLCSLDRYEGYPTLYGRMQVQVHKDGDPIANVLTYFVQKKQPFVAPHPDYLEIIRTAAREHLFPREYRDFLDAIRTGE